MRKLSKLLALALAAAMLLSTAALAAEEETGEEPQKELWMQWINWDEEDYQPDSEVHRNTPQMTAVDRSHMAFYTCDSDGEKLTPVPADKLEASEGVTIAPLCPGVEGKESYVEISVAEWNKEYTVSYDGYSLTLDCRLPDVALYSGPEATTDNYLREWGFTPLSKEECAAYLISTATDETQGRHLVSAALSESCEDSASFQMEKVSDNIYKVSMIGSVDVDSHQFRADITWQNVKFMGGDTYTEEYQFDLWELASVLVSESPTMKYREMETPANYYDVKDEFTNELPLKAGESKTVYTAFTFFPGDPAQWIVLTVGADSFVASDSALKLTTDEEDYTKLTVSCDVPGIYTMFVYNDAYPVFDAMYYEDGTQYTAEELRNWSEDTPYYVDDDDSLVIITDVENWITTSFEEAFPGQKVEYHVVKESPWYPVTITVTGEETPAVSFTDVADTAWYAPAVSYANSAGLMNGSPDGTFNPAGEVTAAQLAQILYNKENKPEAAEGAAFQGVDSQWYSAPILWASGAGIITDTGESAVVPTESLTRQQIALMLYNYMGKPEDTADLTGFSDAAEISDWAKGAVAWAVSAGILNGSEKDGTKVLNPTGTASRAETAQILMNFFG